MAKYLGKDVSRVDGAAKVTGAAKYAAEFQVNNLAHGFLVMSTIAKGRITAIDTKEAEKQTGVIRVFTHLNAPKLAFAAAKAKDPLAPPDGQPFHALTGDKIYFSNQPIAFVVADTYEQARYAARLVKVSYAEEKPVTSIKSSGAKRYVAKSADPPAIAEQKSNPRGDAGKAYRAAPVKFEAEYTIPIEHHNPIEPLASIALWQNGRLVIFDKTQSVMTLRNYLAAVFRIAATDVSVVSPFVGGAFGNSLRPNQTPALAAMAARELKRPVKLVLTRRQMFTTSGYRPATWQKVSLGADNKGKLSAIIHENITNTSSYEDYSENTVSVARMTYACPNVSLDYMVAKTDLPTPSPMRAPGAVSKMFALECALDELAHQLKIDPIELRLINYAEIEPDTGKPWSSKELREAYRQAAEKFGWSKRNPEPRSMRDGNLLVGWGMATAIWGAFQMPASLRITLKSDGTALVQSAASDIGPGTYTVITMIAAEYLGLPMEKVKFELGRSDFPTAPHQGGSWTTASVGSAAVGAAKAIQKKIVELANKNANSPFKEATADQLQFENGKVSLKSNPAQTLSYSEILRGNNLPEIVETYEAKPSPEREKYGTGTHGAQFAEVKVDPDLGTVRVTRIVEATACGKVMNLKTSHSQEMGGAVWGIGMALHEATEVDHRYGRMTNASLADYHVPVNADIFKIETDFVEEDDKIVNELGVKGMGEVGMIGIPAAIANAVFHATGRRIRDLPITPDKLL
jgi:xanthine dehydrogenase YagR molybdenum-binding subunit